MPAIRADGRFVLFSSRATDLSPADADSLQDAYVRDLATGVTELVSIDSNGIKALGDSEGNSISADGRFVSFHSVAANLFPGDAGNDTDVFVRDRLSGTTVMASVDATGNQGAGESEISVFSADGHVIAFRSSAPNLVPNDTNAEWDVFVRDLQAGTIERANLGPGGSQATATATSPRSRSTAATCCSAASRPTSFPDIPRERSTPTSATAARLPRSPRCARADLLVRAETPGFPGAGARTRSRAAERCSKEAATRASPPTASCRRRRESSRTPRASCCRDRRWSPPCGSATEFDAPAERSCGST